MRPIDTLSPRSFAFLIILIAPLFAASASQSGDEGRHTGRDPLFSLRLSGGMAVPRSLIFPADSIIPSSDYDPHRTNIDCGRAAIVGGVLTTTVVGLHIYQRNAWWKDQRRSFHVVEDPDYAKNIDKVGHVFGGAFSTFVGTKSMQWMGVAEEPSVWIGAGIGALFELYVEFEDGFATDWGFSPGDAQADLIGAALPVVQYYVPLLRPLQPQFMYFPSRAMLEGKHTSGIFIDDYEGQTYWLALHVADWMPAEWKRYWPDWLGVAVGISLRNKLLAEEMRDESLKQRNVIIALDYDWRKILPANSWLWRTFAEALNFLHFPSPAIRISPGFIAYGLYFNQ